MVNDQTDKQTIRSESPTRLWPAVLILAIQAVALVITVTPQINNFVRFAIMALAPIVCALFFAIWLLFASGIGWSQRFMIGAGAVASGVFAAVIVDPSMRSTLWFYGVPVAMFLIVAGLVFGRSWRPAPVTKLVLAMTACGWAPFALGHLDGFDGSYWPELRWRWQPTPEQLLMARDRVAPVTTARPIDLSENDWPGFRGASRNSRVTTLRILTDWEKASPEQRWSIPVGPGWSSFAHVGGRLFTQEQRGDAEIVICYDAETGSEIWRHAQRTRFFEIVSGAGPRATPTYSEGRLYVMGAKAALSCLDAATGNLLWQRDLHEEIGARIPMWGFSSSPLVTHGLVIVYADGQGDRALVAYNAATGEPAWHVAGGGMNYSSPQLETIAGIKIILFANKTGLLGIDPETGDVLWQFTPSKWQGPAMVQPQMIGPTSVIVALGDGIGVARLKIERNADDWQVTERWTSRYLKPAFNDFVYHEGYLYGFDQSIFTCIDAQSGKRKWKGGRYGFGQVLMLEASSTLLVISESGEVVHLAADPKEHRELGRFSALSRKTWNHPIIVGNKLFVRNGEEAVCFELLIAPTDKG